ncbi:MAG: tetratricopeptide repeat protein [Woeseiaceae bacterium]
MAWTAAMRDDLHYEFRIGSYTVDAKAGELTGKDTSHHLPPKAMDVLVCLASQAGKVLTHEELLEAVWGDPDHGHDVLSHCISEIRSALGDRPDNPRYIRTIPRRGYQVVATVTPISTSESEPVVTERRQAPDSLWDKLKQRNVVRVSLAYAAVSWLLLQFAEIAFEALLFPEWAMRALFAALGIGFLIAVIVAWVYQVVPEEQYATPKESRRTDRWLQQSVDIAIIAVLAIAVGLLGYRQFVDRPMFDELPVIEAREPSEHSVAVLRFENLGTESRFSDGLAENLLHMLARLRELDVPSRSTTWEIAANEPDLVEVAKLLRVRYVLEGSVLQDEDNIRVFAQLIDGETGNHVWSQNFTEPLTANGFFRTQDEIAQQVVDEIQVTLSDKSQSQIRRASTQDKDALNHYLTGRDYLRRPSSPENLDTAVIAFETALSIDPDYAEAYAGLCEAQLGLYRLNFDAARYPVARDACIQAAEIDDDLPEVHLAMGTLYRYAGRYDDAELQLKKALEISPNTSFILEELGRTFRSANRLTEAEEAFHSAIVAEPSSWSTYKSMGNFLFRTGRYETALPYYRQVLTLRPDETAGWTNFATTQMMLGNFDSANLAFDRVIGENPDRYTYQNYANSLYYAADYETSAEVYRKALDLNDQDYRVWQSMATSLLRAEAPKEKVDDAFETSIHLARKMLEVNPDDPETLSVISVAYARTGNQELARESLRRVAEVGWENPNVSYFVALAYHLLDEHTAAISELERAVLMGFPMALIVEDPDFQALSNNKRYIALASTGRNKPGS